eukprot:360503-Chlamydomonas_euryale.AAC.9
MWVGRGLRGAARRSVEDVASLKCDAPARAKIRTVDRSRTKPEPGGQRPPSVGGSVQPLPTRERARAAGVVALSTRRPAF